MRWVVTRFESPDTERWVLCRLIASSIIDPVAAFGVLIIATVNHSCGPVAFLPVQSAPGIGGPFRNQSHGPSQARGLFQNRSNLANSCSSVHANGSRHGFRIWKSRGLASVLDSATTSTIAWMNPSMPGA
jgi:hypothetical protein